MTRLLIVLALAVLAMPFARVAADVPEFMSYQGLLRDGVGDPVPDGAYHVTFQLYDVETGGSPLWIEIQTVFTVDGVFNAKLGKITPLTSLDFLVPYWLGITVGGDPELTPRVELATVPYAGHAAFADHVLEGDDDWRFDGDNIYRDVGNVGIGISAMDARLDVLQGDGICADFSNGSEAGNFTIRARNYGGTAGGFYAGDVGNPYPTIASAVYAFGGPGHRGGFFVAQGDEEGLLAQSQGNGPALSGWAYGTGYSGYFTGGHGVYCDNQIEMVGFKMPSGAVPGYVLTSDGSGVGTWQPAPGGAGGDITAVYADDGLIGGATSGDAHVGVGAGTGIEVTTDAVGLTLPYSSGSAYDARFVNEGQASSVSSSMITDGQVAFADMQNVFALGSSTWYWSQTTGQFDIDHTGSDYPVMTIDNESNASDGDCLYLSSNGSAAGSSTYVLYSNTYRGKAGQFSKYTDDNQYAVNITGASSSSEGLYVYGTIVSTLPLVRSVETSRGREPVFGVEAADPAVVASGRARLAGGSADVAFDRMFTESVSGSADVRVTVTPIGGWSAIYVVSTAPSGFSVRSASGATDIDFYWTAAGRSKDAVDRAAITLPDPDEERRIEAAKMSRRG
jgi:hypothetical protein